MLVRRLGLAAVAVGVGLAAATGQTVAWADEGHADSSSHAAGHPNAGKTPAGPHRPASGHRPQSKPLGVTPASAGLASGDVGARKSVGTQPNLTVTYPRPAVKTS